MSANTRQTFAQQIASSIERKIVTGKYQIGDRLPTEPQLSEFFGVSRGTVREALKILLSAGILETVQGSGTFVKASERLQIEMHRTLENSSEKDILEIRKMLERHIASSAALNRSRKDLETMREYLEERNTASCRDERMEADQSFHSSIAKATRNRLLTSLYGYVYDYQNEVASSMLAKLNINEEDNAKEVISEREMKLLHENLYKAIEDQDGENAERSIAKIMEAL